MFLMDRQPDAFKEPPLAEQVQLRGFFWAGGPTSRMADTSEMVATSGMAATAGEAARSCT